MRKAPTTRFQEPVLRTRRASGPARPVTRRPFLAMALAALVLGGPRGFGWGSYGHQQIADVAMDLVGLADGAGGRWLDENRRTVLRLSITPDCEWKADGGCPLPKDPALRKLVRAADRFEHPLHWFEPDAFVKDGAVTAATAAALPAGPFETVVDEYARRLAANLDFVKRFPRKRPIGAAGPKPIDVAEHGTAPWRVRQLAELAVTALRERRDARALLYLGTLAHYVGDLSQPLHATMNYDGQVHEPSARGVHAVFEIDALETLARKAGAKRDRRSQLWSSFRATAEGTRRAAQEVAASFASLNGVEDIVASLLHLTVDSYQGVAPLLKAYASQKDPEALLRATLAGEETVRSFIEKRLGAGAAALAAVWRAAFAAAGRAGRGTVPFDVRVVLENYPKPTYLPADVLETLQEGKRRKKKLKSAAIGDGAVGPG